MIPAVRSPDGTVEVSFESTDVRMSMWVHEPLVRRVRDGLLAVDLTGTLLDGSEGVSFPAPHRVRLALRKHPDGARVRYDLVVDVEEETFGLEGDPDRSLAELSSALPELRGRGRGGAWTR